MYFFQFYNLCVYAEKYGVSFCLFLSFISMALCSQFHPVSAPEYSIIRPGLRLSFVLLVDVWAASSFHDYKSVQL